MAIRNNIVAEESEDSGDHNDNHAHVRAVLESVGLDPDDGYEADADTAE